MPKNPKERARAEFGDFQTPLDLARAICRHIRGDGFKPRTVLEPTCGAGAFLEAALDVFPEIETAWGVDRSASHLQQCRMSLAPHALREVRLVQGDFFSLAWSEILATLPDPLLVLGNPPWVTNAGLGVLGSRNLPAKSNDAGLRGIEALTGKSNFDISEWMIRRNLEWLHGRRAVLAMLCKTAVARRILEHAWREHLSIEHAEIRRIDARAHFGAEVDACLLLCWVSSRPRDAKAAVFSTLESKASEATLALREGGLVADLACYERWNHLRSRDREGAAWRSGIKHDAAAVMELRRENGVLRNGLGEIVDVEEDLLFPMRKGSELAAGAVDEPTRWMLVPQRSIGEDTSTLRERAPRAWEYLERHAARLDRRASRIYRGRARFSIFGVGPYAFREWKVAIPALYKRLDFRLVGPHEKRPVVFDDTCLFLPCEDRMEAVAMHAALSSEPAQELFRAFVFWDSKRPITAALLRRLDLAALRREVESPHAPSLAFDAPASHDARRPDVPS